MKTVETKAYISMLRELVEAGKSVQVVISGGSMLPFLAHGRDTIFFEQPKKPLRKGDMVFYQRDSGDYVIHRICKIKPEGLYIVGDAQMEIEGPVRPEQVFAVVTAVRRKGKMLGPGSFWWEFFEHVWIRLVPLRHGILRTYNFIKR